MKSFHAYELFKQGNTCSEPGGTPYKYVTGMYAHIDPHFQTSCNWMTPFLFFTFCSHQMTPIFKLLSHFNNDPILKK